MGKPCAHLGIPNSCPLTMVHWPASCFRWLHRMQLRRFLRMPSRRMLLHMYALTSSPCAPCPTPLADTHNLASQRSSSFGRSDVAWMTRVETKARVVVGEKWDRSWTRWGFDARGSAYFQGPTGENAPYLVLHVVSRLFDLTPLASFIDRHIHSLNVWTHYCFVKIIKSESLSYTNDLEVKTSFKSSCNDVQ